MIHMVSQFDLFLFSIFPKAALFFPTWKSIVCVKGFLAVFVVFSRTKNRFHAHFFSTFHGQSESFTGTFWDFFTYGFFFSRGGDGCFLKIFTYGFRFFTGKKSRIFFKVPPSYYATIWLEWKISPSSPKNGQPLWGWNLIFWFLFDRHNFSVENVFCIFFTCTPYHFHAWKLWEFFTHRIVFSRAVFKIFSRTGQKFHAQKLENFHARDYFFHVGKKKTLGPLVNFPVR